MPARIAQLLVARALLTQEQAGDVLRQQQAQGVHLDTVLLEQGVMGEQDLLALLGEVSGFRPVNLMDFEPNPDVASFIPPKIAERLGVVPLSLDGATLHVACGYPVPKKELDEVGFLLGKPLELWVATEVRVREWISVIYRQALPPRFARLTAILEAAANPEQDAATTPPPPPPQDESLTVEMVERLARSVAQEALPAEVRNAQREPVVARPPPPPPEALREAPRPPPPPPEALREGQRPLPTEVPPPAYVRAPLRLNMPSSDAPSQRAATAPAATQGTAPAGRPAGSDMGATATRGAPETSPAAATGARGAASQGASGASSAGSTATRGPAAQGAPETAVTTATRGTASQGVPETTATRGAPSQGVPDASAARGTPTQGAPAQAASAPSTQPTRSQPPTNAPQPAATAQPPTSRPGTAQPTAPVLAPQPATSGPPQVWPPAQQGPTAPGSPQVWPPSQQGPATSGAPQVWPPPQPGPAASGAPQVWPPLPPGAPATSPAGHHPPTLRFGAGGGPTRADTPPPPPPIPARSGEPTFIVFSNPRAKPETPAPAGPPPRPNPPPPPSGQDVPEWTLAQARAALRENTRDRDRLIDTALRFGRRTFDYVAAFAVVRGAAVGWESRGEGMAGEPLTQVSVPLDASSVFRTVAVTRGSYAGPLPPDALTRHYLELVGRQSPRTIFLYPVEVKGRLVAVIYGDCGQKPISQRRLSDYILFCQDLPAAFQELILFRKQRLAETRASDEPELTIDVEAPVSSTPTPAPAVAAGLGWSPFFGRGSPGGNMGRTAALPPRAVSQEERPPPDFTPLLKRLTGPDAAQRSGAMAELARSPEASARVLAQHFPGPTAWSRLPVGELPEADELGPIPAALSRLGRSAAQALAPLLDSQDPDTRYFALLTAGNLPYVELVDGVLRGLFDMELDISSAARVAAAALKHLPRLDGALRELRQELGSRDALRRSLAARALGTLHDRDAIEALIQLTGSDDEMCAQAAAEALRDVTRNTFGLNPRQWATWWTENRSRRRADWLVSALRHRELDMRLASIEELSRALNDTLGYYADAPESEREVAVRRWEAAAVEPANARRLGML